jgi:hypothetical protein
LKCTFLRENAHLPAAKNKDRRAFTFPVFTMARHPGFQRYVYLDFQRYPENSAVL